MSLNKAIIINNINIANTIITITKANITISKKEQKKGASKQ